MDLFKLNNSDYHQVENLILLYLCLTSVAFGKHSLHYLGPTIWVKLNSYIRSSKPLSIFENGLSM